MRKAPIIPLQKLKDELQILIDKGFTDMSPKLSKDLGKIEFDWENYEVDLYEDYRAKYKPQNSITGVYALSSGLYIYLGYAGGDWEWPVHFALYWDGKEIRGYIPKEGNAYNKKTKMAYGNEDDGDEDHSSEENIHLMLKDIKERIEII